MKTINELIEQFPVTPPLPIVLIAYNADMIGAIENTIIETHGQRYFDEYVVVLSANTARSNDFTLGGPAAIYLDPRFYQYHSNGYN